MARKGLFPASVKAGVPKIPNLPEGWSLVPFGEVVKVVERPAALKDDNEYQLVTAKRSRGGIVPRDRLLGKEILTKTQFYTNTGDFLISRRQIIHGACGLVPQSLDGAIVSNEYSTLLTKPNLLKEYFTYFSHTIYFQQTCFQSSVGVDIEKMIFKIDDWLKYKFPLPPLPEQQKIAEILSSVDDAIARTQAVIDQTRKVKQGLLQQLLTRGIGHTKFKETPIGRIPESWEVKPIGQISQVGNGSTPSKAREDYWKGGSIPWISSGKVNERRITEPTDYITENALKECPLKLLPVGTILVAMIGQGKTRGMSAALEIEATINQNLAYIQPNSELDTDFLLIHLQHNYERLRSGGRGSNQDALNCRLIKEFLIPFPPLFEQKEIARAILSIETSEIQYIQSIEQYKSIKQGLMQDLLTGRVRAVA